MNDEIFNKKIIVSVGSGGVGKTTISSTLGLQAAIIGKKTLVLTIDPAKRLANALGLDSLGVEPQKIDLTPLKKYGVTPKGELYAMMLDRKNIVDKMVESDISNDKKDKLFENSAYKAFSSSLPGTQEFAAMNLLAEIAQKKEYDLIVLDTPPTTNALDFFSAPERLFNIFENQFTKLLIQMYEKSGGIFLKFFQFSSQFILKGLSKFVGVETLEVIASFLFHISDLMDGIKVRSLELHKLFKSKDVAFYIITSPQKTSLEEALFFQKEIEKYDFNLAGFIVNRVHPSFESENVIGDLDDIMTIPQIADMGKHKISEIFSVLEQNRKFYHQKHIQDLKELSILKNAEILKIPFLNRDISDITALLDIINALNSSI
ncbi:ArsA family ATPase [bacterium]|nr:ArsA family ATPase [bacterium]